MRTNQMRLTLNPKILVIVAIKNEEKFIAKCINSLIHQNFPKNFYKIVVIDGESNDDSVHIVEGLITQHPKIISLYTNPKEWQSSGRNIAILNEVECNLITYLDGHCVAHPDWLKALYFGLCRIDDKDVAGIGSVVSSPLDETSLGKAINKVFSSIIGGGGSSYRPSNTRKRVNTVPFVLYKRKAIMTVGLYDDDLKCGEDFALNHKLNCAGYKLFVEPNAIVYYYKRNSLKNFFTQMYNYGFAKAVIFHRYPRALGITHFLPIIFFLSSLLLLFLSVFDYYFQFLFFILLSIYIFVILSYTLFINFREMHLYSSLPILFLIEHIAYSIGFIEGFIKKRW